MSPTRDVSGVRSQQEFHRAIARERARTDRTEQEFSLLVLDGDIIRDIFAAQDLVRALTQRIRRLDEIGWFDEERMGLLLPHTPAAGAAKLAAEIRRMFAHSLLACTIYTYPGQWLPPETGTAENEFELLFADPMPVWKRAMDIAGSSIGLVCLFPVLLLVAAVIKLISAGPVILKQKRVGLRGKTFVLWKFRTMRVNADQAVHQDHLRTLMTNGEPMTKLDATSDPRIIPFGNLIRCCYLDELLQLINVLRGDMSLVGPRPCVPYEAEQYGPWQRRRFNAVPGMTGLWQVNGKNSTTFNEMIRLDIKYVNHTSFWLDVRILLQTLPVIFCEMSKVLSGRRYETQPNSAPVEKSRAVRKTG